MSFIRNNNFIAYNTDFKIRSNYIALLHINISKKIAHIPFLSNILKKDNSPINPALLKYHFVQCLLGPLFFQFYFAQNLQFSLPLCRGLLLCLQAYRLLCLDLGLPGFQADLPLHFLSHKRYCP